MSFKVGDLIVHVSGKERIRQIEDINLDNGKYRFTQPFGTGNFVAFGEVKDFGNYDLVKDIPQLEKMDLKVINELITKVNHLNKLILG